MLRRYSIAIVCLSGIAFFGLVLLQSPHQLAAKNEPAKASLSQKRVPWTNGKISGSPEQPQPYALPDALPGVKFDKPLLMTQVPHSPLMVVGEQYGKLYTVNPKDKQFGKKLLLDLKADYDKLKPNPEAKEFEMVYGIAFHPNYLENQICYVSYTFKGKKGEKTGVFDPEKNLHNGTRVSKFKMLGVGSNDLKIDTNSEEVVLTFPQGGHNGADLHFGNDKYLYISTGDAADPNPPDPWKTGTDCSDLLSAILRIDVDHKENNLNYAIPKDNPFINVVHDGKPVRPEIWCYGFRNPWRMSFDRVTGDLWIGDVGWEQWEMIHKGRKGSNHGWSVMEARQPINTTLNVGPTPNITPPVIELDHTQAASMTGGYVYRGKKFPELVGKYIFGDYMTKRIWAATMQGDRCTELIDLTEPTCRITAFGEDADGEIYLVDNDTGFIHTFERNSKPNYNPADFPKTLSATGIYSEIRSNQLAPGVYPFAVNAEGWQDGATSERFFAIAGEEKIIDWDGRKQLGGNIEWLPFQFHFPKDSVLGRTLTANTVTGPKKIETQILHYDGRYWLAYTYQWRDDQADADLVAADGSEKDLTIVDNRIPEGKRAYTWNFNSRVQCLTCHTPWAEVSLAFNTMQLNRPGDDGKNQLVSLCENGFLERRKKDGKPNKPYDAKIAKNQDALADPHNDKAVLDDRARSYLHVNCSHCHRNGGGGSVSMDLTLTGDWKKNVLDCSPMRGTFGISDAKVVASANPEKSTLLYRISKYGKDRMPHIGSEIPDTKGMALIAEWISTKGEGKAIAVQPNTTESGVKQALDWAKQDKLNSDQIRQIAAMPQGPVRDLFEGYIPHAGERKLGPNPRPRAILSLKGDVEKGKELFFNARNQCSNCHQIDGKGVAIGPDLSKIGKDQKPEQILESILEPSRRVEAQYQAYNVTLEDGRTVTGVIVKKDATGTIIRDALGKDISCAKDNIESLKASPTSLMAAGLLMDFTPQQAADLLAYLVSRK